MRKFYLSFMLTNHIVGLSRTICLLYPMEKLPVFAIRRANLHSYRENLKLRWDSFSQ